MLSSVGLWRSFLNEEQAELSGCGHRSIDPNAIDSANVDIGAQHERGLSPEEAL
jgi:hypothetical protein